MVKSKTLQASFLGLSRVLATCAFLMSSVILSRLLSKDDYGTFRQCWMLFLIVSPFFTLGLGQSLFYFVPKVEQRAMRPLVVRTFLIVATFSLFAGLLLLIFSETISHAFSNSKAKMVFALFSLFLAAAIPATIIDGLFMPIKKIWHTIMFNFLNRFVVFGGCALPVWLLGIGIDSGLTIMGGVQLLITLILFILVLKIYPKNSRPGMPISFVQQIKYSWAIAVAGIFGGVFIQLDKIVAGFLLQPDEFAVYSNGALENPLIAILTSATSVVIAADLVRYFDLEDRKNFIELWKRASKKAASLALPMACFLFIFSEEAVEVLYSRKYLASAEIFRLYMLLAPVRILSFTILFMAISKNIIYLYGHIAASAIGALACYLGYLAFGTKGLAGATIITTYIVAGSFLFVITRELKTTISFFLPCREIILILASGISVAFVTSKIISLAPINSAILKLTAGGMIFVMMEVTTMYLLKIIEPKDWPVLYRMKNIVSQ